MHHLVQADAPRRHALGIELHLELPQVSAETLDGRHSRHGKQAVVDFELGKIAQGHEIGCTWLRFERELEDLVQAACEARDEWRVGARPAVGPSTWATRSATNWRER